MALHSLRKALGIIEALQWLEIGEAYFKLKKEKFVFKSCRPLQKIQAKILIDTMSAKRHLLVLFVAAMVGLNQFWHFDTIWRKSKSSKNGKFSDALRKLKRKGTFQRVFITDGI